MRKPLVLLCSLIAFSFMACSDHASVQHSGENSSNNANDVSYVLQVAKTDRQPASYFYPQMNQPRYMNFPGTNTPNGAYCPYPINPRVNNVPSPTLVNVNLSLTYQNSCGFTPFTNPYKSMQISNISSSFLRSTFNLFRPRKKRPGGGGGSDPDPIIVNPPPDPIIVNPPPDPIIVNPPPDPIIVNPPPGGGGDQSQYPSPVTTGKVPPHAVIVGVDVTEGEICDGVCEEDPKPPPLTPVLTDNTCKNKFVIKEYENTPFNNDAKGPGNLSPQQISECIKRSQFNPAGGNYSTCKGVPNDQPPCVNNDYHNRIVNTFNELSQCLEVVAENIFVNLNYESQFHINRYNREGKFGASAGIAQLATYLDKNKNPAGELGDIYNNVAQVLTKGKKCGQKYNKHIKNKEDLKKYANVKNKCALIDPKHNPERSLFLGFMGYKTFEYYMDNHLRGTVTGGYKKCNLKALPEEIKRGLKAKLTMLAYHRGPGKTINELCSFLKSEGALKNGKYIPGKVSKKDFEYSSKAAGRFWRGTIVTSSEKSYSMMAHDKLLLIEGGGFDMEGYGKAKNGEGGLRCHGFEN